jgi:hypothetical protein
MWLVRSVIDAIGVCLLLWVVKTWIVKGLSRYCALTSSLGSDSRRCLSVRGPLTW